MKLSYNKYYAQSIVRALLRNGYKARIYRISKNRSCYIRVKHGKAKTNIRVSDHVPYHAPLEKFNFMTNYERLHEKTSGRKYYYGRKNIGDLINDLNNTIRAD